MSYKSRWVKEHYTTISVRRETYEKLRKLAESRGVRVQDLIEELANKPQEIKPQGIETDCTARLGRSGRTYWVECRDGSKALIPVNNLELLSSRFGLRIKVVTEKQ